MVSVSAFAWAPWKHVLSYNKEPLIRAFPHVLPWLVDSYLRLQFHLRIMGEGECFALHQN